MAEKPSEARPEGVPGYGNTEVIGGLLGQSCSVVWWGEHMKADRRDGQIVEETYG